MEHSTQGKERGGKKRQTDLQINVLLTCARDFPKGGEEDGEIGTLERVVLGVVADLDVTRLGPRRLGHGAAEVMQALVLGLTGDNVDEVGATVVGVRQRVFEKCQVHLQ